MLCEERDEFEEVEVSDEAYRPTCWALEKEEDRKEGEEDLGEYFRLTKVKESFISRSSFTSSASPMILEERETEEDFGRS